MITRYEQFDQELWALREIGRVALFFYNPGSFVDFIEGDQFWIFENRSGGLGSRKARGKRELHWCEMGK